MNKKGEIIMMDYEHLFATALHAKLKKKIVGKIYVEVTRENVLLVKIESFGGLSYSTTIDNFSDKIINGFSTDYAAYEIVDQYKKFITKKFLK